MGYWKLVVPQRAIIANQRPHLKMFQFFWNLFFFSVESERRNSTPTKYKFQSVTLALLRQPYIPPKQLKPRVLLEIWSEMLPK